MMEPRVPPSNIFQFSDPRQKRIYERLHLIGPGPAAYYRDACRILSSNPEFGTVTHLVAHMYREVESSLRAVGAMGTSPRGKDLEDEIKVTLQSVWPMIERQDLQQVRAELTKLEKLVERDNHKQHVGKVLANLE